MDKATMIKLPKDIKQKLFVRIYLLLITLCLVVMLCAYNFLNIINDYRAQDYREKLATSVFSVLTQGIADKDTAEKQQDWLADANDLFDGEFNVFAISHDYLTTSERKRLAKNLSVVHYDKRLNQSQVYHKIPNTDTVLSAKIKSVNEKQAHAFGAFILDDLAQYPSQEEKQQRLQLFSNKTPFSFKYRNFGDLKLDSNYLSRIHQGQSVSVFTNSAGVENSIEVRTFIPTNEFKQNESKAIIEITGLRLFNSNPLPLVLLVIIFSTIFIGVGVYVLIFPLEKRLQLLKSGLDKISHGKLETRLVVKGEDEISQLVATFNVMATHIKRLIESQRELTRAVSHELRTPVARIRFAVDMLADTDDEESRQTQRDYIDQDIEELNKLIDEILTYAKLEEGSPVMCWEKVDLIDLIEKIERETKALGKDIQITTQYANIDLVAEADRHYLHRVVQNLVGNALRHANSSILIRAEIQRDTAFISVEDDGEGIPAEDREKIFIPFARLDDSRTRSSGGYGLGLSIVARICFWFNGDIRIEDSHKLGGAKFIMSWPVKQLAKPIVSNELDSQSVS